MKHVLLTAAATLALAAPAFAQDADKGAKEFRKCQACHTVADDDGNVLHKGGRTGPNLYAVIGRTAGTTEFKYSSIMVAAGEAGLVWDAENFGEFIADPNGFLSAAAGESGRSKMAKQRVKNPADIVAYLESLLPAE